VSPTSADDRVLDEAHHIHGPITWTKTGHTSHGAGAHLCFPSSTAFKQAKVACSRVRAIATTSADPSEILRLRPDIDSVGHTHPFYSQIFASTDEPLRAIAKEGAVVRRSAEVPRNVFAIRTPELGVRVAETLGKSDAVFLMAHGIAFTGATVRECTMVGIYLGSRSARADHDRHDRLSLQMARRGRSSRETRADAQYVRIDNYWEYVARRDAATRSAASTQRD